MCGFDIRCSAEQETEVNGMGNHLLIMWNIGPERASPVPRQKTFTQQFYNVWKKRFETLKCLIDYCMFFATEEHCQQRDTTILTYCTVTYCNFVTVICMSPSTAE